MPATGWFRFLAGNFGHSAACPEMTLLEDPCLNPCHYFFPKSRIIPSLSKFLSSSAFVKQNTVPQRKLLQPQNKQNPND
jgi:hypothetical protein